MKPSTLAFALILAITTAVKAEPEIKGTAIELSEHLAAVPRTVSLSGESEVKVPSDRALVSLSVVTEHKSLQEASRQNQELRAKLLKTLAGQGIAADRIQVSKFSSTPKYGVFGDKAKSYRVENVVKITAQDEKEFQAVANLVDTHAEVRYESIEFEHSDKEGLKKKVLEQALDKVADKQRLYQEKLGVKLKVKGFAEGRNLAGDVVVGRRMYAGLDGSYGKGTTVTAIRSAGPMPEAVSEALPTSFAEMIFRAQVAVEYTVLSP